MTPFGLGFFVWLLSKLQSGTSPPAEPLERGRQRTPTAWKPPAVIPKPQPPVLTASTAPAKAATDKAAAANAKAVKAPTPTNIREAFAASDAAKSKLMKQAAEIKEAAKAPAPWRATPPTDLPPWPGGWEPDLPPPPAVVTRAWQLLPELWRKGKGTRKVETIKGRWIAFVAADHGGGKKGVTAFRVKGAARG
jgi:hypothetical protein